MIELKILLDEVDYRSLSEVLIPALAESMAKDGGVLGGMLSQNKELAASMARTVLDKMPQEKKDELLVQLLDSRHAPSADDEMMLEYLAHHEVPFIAALTKADKLKKSQYAETAARFAEICAPYGCRGVVLTSADNGYGIPELRDVLDQFLAEG